MLRRTLCGMVAALPSPIKYRMGWLKPLNTSVLAWPRPVVRVRTAAGAVNWHIDALSTQRYIRGVHEPYMQNSLVNFLRPGAVAFDVGAHVGFHSLVCGLLVGSSGRVVAFEPDPHCRQSLQREMQANPSLPITALPYVVSDSSGKVRLHLQRSGQSRVCSEGGALVEATTLDALVGGGRIPAPDLIKIDVEGHEVAVLRGAKTILEKHHPTVLCDFNDRNTFGLVRDLLTPLGYEVSGSWPTIAVARDWPKQ